MTTQADVQLAPRSETTPVSRKTVQLSPVPVERFADYNIVAKVGQGGMAEVFLAMTEGPNGFRKLLALKRLHVHLGQDGEHVDMFLAEARLAARLHHPNIVQTNEVGCFAGHHFMAMEYLDGQPLDRVLARLRKDGQRLSPALAVAIVCEVLEGLHYAHEARDYDGAPLNVVHRDVSPHNVFITYDGQVKLLDFGIAKNELLESHTRSGIIRGKLSYIAPEQARCERVDRRADIWSLGVTLWQCLSGQRLFQGADDVSVLRAALRDEIPLLSDVAEDVPEALARVVGRALQRDPQQRYQSALSFKEELEDWLHGQQVAGLRGALTLVMRSLFDDQIQAREQLIAASFARASTPPPPPVRARDSLQLELLQPVPPSSFVALVKRRPVLALAAAASLVGAGFFFSAPKSEQKVAAVVLPRVVAEPTGSTAKAPVAAASVQPDHVPAARAEETPGPHAQPATRAHHGTRRHASSAAVEVPEVPEQPAPVVEEKAPERGHLSLDTVPYSVVFLGGERLGITPLEVDLVAAKHTLVLRNPERGIETSYQVTIRAGASVERRVALD